MICHKYPPGLVKSDQSHRRSDTQCQLHVFCGDFESMKIYFNFGLFSLYFPDYINYRFIIL